MGRASGEVLGPGMSGPRGPTGPGHALMAESEKMTRPWPLHPQHPNPRPHAQTPGGRSPVQRGVSPGKRRGGRRGSQVWGGRHIREVDAGPRAGALGKQEDPCSSWGGAAHRPGGLGTEVGGSAHLSGQSHQITRGYLEGPDAKGWGECRARLAMPALGIRRSGVLCAMAS